MGSLQFLSHLYTIEKWHVQQERIQIAESITLYWEVYFTHGSVRGWGWNSLALLDPMIHAIVFHCLDIGNILDDDSFAALSAACQEYHFWIILTAGASLIVVYHKLIKFMHLTRPRKGTINHENEHNVATIQAYYPPNSTIWKKAYTPTIVAYRPLLFPWSAGE